MTAPRDLPANRRHPLAFTRYGKAHINSRDVAAFFQTDHGNMLAEIDDLVVRGHGRFFEPWTYEAPSRQPGGDIQRTFDMVRHGFLLLSARYQGEKVAHWKRRILESFDAMDDELAKMNATAPLAMRPQPPAPAPARESGMPYQFEGRSVRIVEMDGEPWFVASDIARELGYREAFNLTRTLDDDEKAPHTVRTVQGDQEVTLISEPGLYRAIVQRRSNKKHDASLTAKIGRFQRWVFHDVLPSIRKTGGYQVAPAFDVPRTLPEALRLAASLAEKVEEQTVLIDEMRPQVETLDRIAGLDGLFSVRVTAKLLQMQERKFTDWIQRIGWAYRQPGTRALLCYADKHKAGYALNKASAYLKSDGSQGIRDSLRFTPKGIVKLGRMLGMEFVEGDLLARTGAVAAE